MRLKARAYHLDHAPYTVPRSLAYSPQTIVPIHPMDRPLTAVLGPTNTGKTHYAIERMLSFKSGMIGLPLRLLAREIYDKLLARRPAAEIALVTGEEKIIPRSARYWVCTVEAMPLEQQCEFLAIDEIQLANNPERGRTFTSRLLYARGSAETLLLGSDTMAPILRQLFPNISFISRERFSKLTFSGSKKVTRLPRRSAIVAFSADTVYAIAELVRRQRGGTAVVLGALSPRTRNAQAALYQEGEVDYLIATDAIGMGLNMDIDHVAFAGRRKFDGRSMRDLTPSETAQIAGRAGRYLNDGTFGITADCPDFDEELVEAIEEHRFEPVRGLFWRAEALNFSSLSALQKSLDKRPDRPELIRARPDDDERALAILVRDEEISKLAKGGAALSLLWDVCELPDFRKVSIDQHTTLIGELYLQLMQKERIKEDWLAPRVNRLDRDDGDIDTLSARIAYIRSWTYLSHRASWVENAPYWQERTRAIEDKLSDALHHRLTQRFVDRRTSILLKRLKDNAPLLAGVNEDGDVIVEGQFVGRLLGFEFILDPRANGAQAKPVRAAAERALQPLLASRASHLANAPGDDLSILPDGSIAWRSSVVAQLEKGPAPLRPNIMMRNTDLLPAVLRGRIEDRLQDYFANRVESLLAPLIAMQRACDETGDDAFGGVSRGVAFRLVENFGATSRTLFGDELKQINQEERAKLRKHGMRFGEYTLFMPALLKPAPASLLTLLWALWTDRKPVDFVPPKAGLVSIEVSDNVPHAYYYACGYRPSGKRAVRIDMLERLAGDIRKAREKGTREGFEATSQMMSLVGCSGEDFEAILTSLNFRKNTVKRKKPVPEAQATLEENKAEDKTASATGISKTNQDAPNAQAPNTQITEESASPETPPLEPTPENSPADETAMTEPAGDIATEKTETDNPENDSESAQIVADTPPEGAVQEASAQSSTETSNDDTPSDEGEEIEVVLWRYQAKRPPRARAKKDGAKKEGDQQTRQNRSDQRGNKKRDGKGGKNFKGKPKAGGRKPDRVQNPHMNKPRHLKTADPDSPFAVLAALQDKK